MNDNAQTCAIFGRRRAGADGYALWGQAGGEVFIFGAQQAHGDVTHMACVAAAGAVLDGDV